MVYTNLEITWRNLEIVYSQLEITRGTPSDEMARIQLKMISGNTNMISGYT